MNIQKKVNPCIFQSHHAMMQQLMVELELEELGEEILRSSYGEEEAELQKLFAKIDSL